ncbi:transposable element Tcb2 transposase [Trichonephila clavipes]|nr:transposable element Tcb2 transposase [Trichonephila clavipes]
MDFTVLQLTLIVRRGSSQQISAQTMLKELQRTGMHSRVPSDESRYSSFSTDRKYRIWREPYEGMNPSCFTRTVQGSGGSIMIKGMLCWDGSGVLVIFEGKQTAMRYLDMLVDQMHPEMLHFHPDGDGYFMENNATIHHDSSVRNWFPEHQSDFQHLLWKPHSSNLNLIENV